MGKIRNAFKKKQGTPTPPENVFLEKGTIVKVNLGAEGPILNGAMRFIGVSEDGKTHDYVAYKDAIARVGKPERGDGQELQVRHLFFAREAREELDWETIADDFPIEEKAFARACYQHGLKPISVPRGVCPLAYEDEIIVRQRINEGQTKHFIVPPALVDSITEFAAKLAEPKTA